MRVLFWNCGGGPSGEKLDWLGGEQWDLAVLAEVSKTGWERVQRRHSDWSVTSSLSGVPTGRGKRMGIVIAARGPAVVAGPAPAPPPELTNNHRDRFAAATVHSETVGSFTAFGFHAPHGAGTAGQSPKEEAYKALHYWLSLTDGDVVGGLDTNTWTTRARPPTTPLGDVRPSLVEQSAFQYTGARHQLRDAFIEAAQADPTLHEPECWWTYDTKKRKVRMDQVWVSAELTTMEAHVCADAPRIRPGGAHRPVVVTLARSNP